MCIFRSNFADDIINVINKQGDGYVQAIMAMRADVPTVLLYTQQQIEDLKTWCILRDEDRSVLGIDKTYNLCDVYVTVTVFKLPCVQVRRTSQPPIMLGPIMLHGRSDFQTFHYFLSHLAGKLVGCDLSRLTVGTEYEQGLVQAVRRAVPQAKHVLCVEHLKKNVTQYLKDSVCSFPLCNKPTFA